MKTLFQFAVIGAFLSAGIALGAGSPDQQGSQPNANPTPSVASKASQDSKTVAAPLSGKNSFTTEQVRRRLERHGFSSVHDLQLDHRGVWNGNALHGGAEVQVSIDYQGNITSD